MKKNYIYILKKIIFIIFISLVGCAGVIFTVLYIETFEGGFWDKNSFLVTSVSVILISLLTCLTITFIRFSKTFAYKLLFMFTLSVSFVMLIMFLIKQNGFLDRVNSIEDLRNYISSFDKSAVLIFILIQFLQVVVLPLPSFLTVGAGVLLFGPFKGAIYSSVGIIIGSIVAFYIGRVFGSKVANWLVGKKSLDKALKVVKGKDKIIFTFMFLFPFFPDDVLCFVAGITSMSPEFFVYMIIITRLISVFASSYSMNNSIIPYNNWWGICIWCLFFALTMIFAVLIYKNGEKIENKFTKKKKCKNNK